MTKSLYPLLYQVNTRVWLNELSRTLGRPATLDDVPDTELDRLAAMGFDWIWLLSVWRTGLAGQQVSRTQPDWLKDFEATLSDLRERLQKRGLFLDLPPWGFHVFSLSTSLVVPKGRPENSPTFQRWEARSTSRLSPEGTTEKGADRSASQSERPKPKKPTNNRQPKDTLT